MEPDMLDPAQALGAAGPARNGLPEAHACTHLEATRSRSAPTAPAVHRCGFGDCATAVQTAEPLLLVGADQRPVHPPAAA